MSNTTDTYWDVAGTSLNTLAFNIETWGADREAPPPMRGSNVLVPYRPGEVYVEKIPDTRTISFGMWVLGATEDGGVPAPGTTQRQQFEANWQKLRTLLYNGGRPFALTKRFRVGGIGSVVTATAAVEFAGGLNLSMTGQTRGVFTVDLKMAEPFFLGNEIIENFTSATRSRTITVPGDYDTTYITWVINGAVSNPALWNNSQGFALQIARSFGLNETGTIDVDQFTAIHLTNSGTVSTAFHGNLTPDDYPFWFYLRPGTQAILVTQTSGTGLVQLKYRPRWI